MTCVRNERFLGGKTKAQQRESGKFGTSYNCDTHDNDYIFGIKQTEHTIERKCFAKKIVYRTKKSHFVRAIAANLK